MLHKPIARMILPLALAGILILAVLTSIPSNNHAFACGNSFTFASPTSPDESNNTGNGQEGSNTGNTQQQSSSTGNTQESKCQISEQQQSADFANSILAVHNPERAAVNANVPPLVWSDKARRRHKVLGRTSGDAFLVPYVVVMMVYLSAG